MAWWLGNLAAWRLGSTTIDGSISGLLQTSYPVNVRMSVVPTGLEIVDTVPTDKSVGYFHLSLRDKMHVYKKMGMHPQLIKDMCKGSKHLSPVFQGKGVFSAIEKPLNIRKRCY